MTDHQMLWATFLCTYGIVAHFVGDWLLQSKYISDNKHDIAHKAAWLHGAIHAALLAPLFGVTISLIIGLIHIAVDTRKPLLWWSKVMAMPKTGEAVLHIAIWRDQVVHILVIAMFALWKAVLGV